MTFVPRIPKDLTKRIGEALPTPEGTHCSNCSALNAFELRCKNADFQKWNRAINGSGGDGSKIPAPEGDPRRYCCIYWTRT